MPRLDDFSEFVDRQRRPRSLDHDGLRAAARQAAARTRRSASTSCRSCPTNRAPSAWKRLFRQCGIYAHVGQLYEPVDAEHAAVLSRSQGRPDPGRRHHRSRLDVVVHRRRHRLRHARHQHDPVLHLLLDVRLPAHRRPDLGRRRHAGQGLPARRHRRPHHAQRRRPAASGRPQPSRSPSPSPRCAPTTRPSPTRSPSSCSTACSGCTKTAKT